MMLQTGFLRGQTRPQHQKLKLQQPKAVCNPVSDVDVMSDVEICLEFEPAVAPMGRTNYSGIRFSISAFSFPFP